jgi:RND superfamily putative drug exporter
VIWLLVLAASIPLAMNLSEVTTSGSGEVETGDAESSQAQAILDERFPQATANSSAIVVLRGQDVTDEPTKRFVLDLEEELLAEGVLNELEEFTSAYTVQRSIISEGTKMVAPLLFQTNFTAFVVYGVPATFVGNWLLTNTSWNVTDRDAAANQSTTLFLQSMAAAQGLNNTTQDMIFGYYGLFYQNWAATAGNGTLVADPFLRAQTAVDAAVPTFSLGLPDPMLAGFFTGVWQAFNLTSWSQTEAVYSYVNVQLAAFGMAPLASDFLDEVALLGPLPDPAAVEALVESTIQSGSLDSYPMRMPDDLLRRFVSETNDTMILFITFSKAPRGFGSPEGDPTIEDVRTVRKTAGDLRDQIGAPDALYVTGDAAASLDSSESAQEDIERIDPVTIVALVILVSLFFLSVVTVIAPLASIFMALLVAQGVIYLIGTFFIKVPQDVFTFLFVVLLGVGMDYAVFLIARYREERLEGEGREAAVRTSVTWAGESITTSGIAVIIAFGVLTIGSFGLVRAMGYAVGIGVAMALLVSLTLIPALLMLAGNRIFWPTSGKRFERLRERRSGRRARGDHNYFRKAATFSVKHAKAVLLIAVLISIPTTYISLTGSTTFDFIGGLPETESVMGLQAMKEGFGAGQLGPTLIVVEFADPIMGAGGLTPEAQGSLELLSQEVADLGNVKEVAGPTRPRGSPIDATNLSALDPTEQMEVLGAVGEDQRTALLTVIFVDEPFTTASLETVDGIRSVVDELQKTDPTLSRTTILVGCQSALTKDFSTKMDEEFLTMRIIVVVAIFIVLLLVLGSYLLPLAAILTIGLSITWAYAATLLFFNQVLGAEVLFVVPLILFILLMGIGMDYNIFILTRIREEAEKGKGPGPAAIEAVDRTGGIITALAMILAAALGSLMLSSNRLLQGFGFAIALAVLLDAMVVRTYLVPAIIGLLGKWAWWGPRALRRVDVEEPED